MNGNGTARIEASIASETGCSVGYDSSDLSSSRVEKLFCLKVKDVVLEVLSSATDMGPAYLAAR
jgi:hypothetical protein